MKYIPHTPEDVRQMLAAIGVSDVAELFQPIPENLRLKRELDLPAAMTEWALKSLVDALAAANVDSTRAACFAGAGLYNHFVPAAVGQLLLRSEFYTAYTPYQPEVSQGTLQAIFEFQTMIARLLAMEVASASLYDGSTATAEAIGMALRKFRGKRSRILLCGAIHPEYLAVAETYAQTPDKGLQALAPGGDGRADLAALRAALGPDVAAVVVQHPNFYGLLEDLAAIRALTAEHEALLIVTFTEPMAFGMLKPPGEFGADIVVGEGQSFGLPTGFGGPLLGLMATRKEHVRLMPGRLVGRTKDRNGNDAFVITLATREQHIRREKATSNICTNEGLCALACAIYLSLLGNEGLAKLAALNHHVSCTLKAMLGQVPGVRFPFSGGAHFNELVVELPGPAAQVVEKMADQGIVAGVPLSRWYPDQPTRLLVAATELNDAAGLKAYVEALASLV